MLDELPTFGRVWRELSEEAANKQTVVNLIANGEFHDPMRVIAFNVAGADMRLPDLREKIAQCKRHGQMQRRLYGSLR